MPALTMLLKALHAANEHLEKSFLRDFVPKLKDCVVERLASISDNEIKSVDRNSITQIVEVCFSVSVLFGLHRRPAIARPPRKIGENRV